MNWLCHNAHTRWLKKKGTPVVPQPGVAPPPSRSLFQGQRLGSQCLSEPGAAARQGLLAEVYTCGGRASFGREPRSWTPSLPR